MATTVTNKTRAPLSVPLPRGKVLHLGPGKSGQITVNAVEHPPLKALVERGDLEIVGEGAGKAGNPGGDQKGPAPTHGHASTTGGRRSGDR